MSGEGGIDIGTGAFIAIRHMSEYLCNFYANRRIPRGLF